MDRFDKFDGDARRALALAQDEAAKFGQSYIGTEHILLGLLRLPDSTAGRVLGDLVGEPAMVRTAVEFIIGRAGQLRGLETGLTPRAKRVIELAIDEARRLGHKHIGTEHLLLGLVREGEGIAAGVLESLGVDIDRARIAILGVSPSTTQRIDTRYLADVLQALDVRGIGYRMGRVGNGILVALGIADQRWEIRFLDAGGVEIERFGSIRGIESDVRLLDELLARGHVPIDWQPGAEDGE